MKPSLAIGTTRLIKTVDPIYRRRVMGVFGDAVIGYWPLSDYLWGAVNDISGRGNLCSFSGTTPQAVTSIAGLPCPQFSTGHTINMAAANLPALFNGLEGSISAWVKPTNSGVWADTTQRFILHLRADANNYILVTSNGTGWLLCYYVAGGTTYLYNCPIYSSGWTHVTVSWSHTANRWSVFLNGMLAFRQLMTSSWAGALMADTAIGGSWGTFFWNGYISDVFCTNREMTDFENRQIGYVSTPAKRLTFLGDSLTVHNSVYSTYPHRLMASYNGGNVGIHNVAVGGASIMSGLADQVAQVTGDDADSITIALGTGDWDAGDMEALKTTLRTQIGILQSTNPRAKIDYANVWPRWTDTSGSTPVLFPNIRSAISTVCAELGATCWDTFTSPWFNASDTIDGLHAIDTGQTKIETQMLSRL